MEKNKITKEEKEMLIDLIHTYVDDINFEEFKDNEELYNKYKRYEELSFDLIRKIIHA